MLLLAPNIDSEEKNTVFANMLGFKVPSLSIDEIENQFGFRNWIAEKRLSKKQDVDEQITDNTFYLQQYFPDDMIYGNVLKDLVKFSYNVIQYTEVYNWLDYFLNEELLTIKAALNVNNLKFAITCDINPDILERKNISITGEDKLFSKVIIALSHDGSLRSVHFSLYDAVCANTLQSSQVMAMGQSKKFFNIESLRDLEDSRHLIDLFNQQFNVLDVFEIMKETKLEKDQVNNILRFVNNLSPNYDFDPNADKMSTAQIRYGKMLESYNKFDPRWDEKDDNGWRLYNAYTDIVKGNSEKNTESNFYSNISNQSKRSKFQSLILELA
jgi:hypothetical protein